MRSCPISACLSTMTTALVAQLRAVLDGHPDICQALLFGSLAGGAARADSDLDLAVAAQRPLGAAQKAALIAALAAAVGRPVDLIDLKTVGEPLLGQILKQGQRIIGSDADYAALIRRHLFDAADFQPNVDRILRERRQAWIG